ncbi:MAG: DUF5597 domain-containing protein [Bacillota bacterium]
MVVPAGRVEAAGSDGPRLVKQGSATQLLVQGNPFLIVGGELHNSSASSLQYMEPIWGKLKALNLNTVLATVSWELLEPEEGKFDFRLVDGLIEGARKNNLKLVFLWFGSWKNGVSSYIPGWVKTDIQRFPRVRNRGGSNVEVLSPVAESNCQADAKALVALMRHIKQVDQDQQTVVMIQIENEVGTLGDSRDHSALAEAEFAKAVPVELMDYFQKHKNELIPEFKKYWEAAGFKTSGTWTDVFGEGADEAFMAWHMARYIGKIAAAGKAEYNLPMYANAWLVQHENQKAGQYPSGGPVSKVMDIWRAAAPSIDFLAPDIYLPDFKGICASYTRNGNPLFIPEASPSPDAGAKAFWAIAQCNGIGFCPFGIDSVNEDHPLKDSYKILAELMPMIAKYQGTGQMIGIYQDKQDVRTQRQDLGDYHLEINFDNARNGNSPSFGLAIYLGNGEYLVAGVGVGIHFSAKTPGPRETRILSIDEGHFKDGQWVPGRRMNGDENAGGWRLQLQGTTPSIQRIKLYRHD